MTAEQNRAYQESLDADREKVVKYMIVYTITTLCMYVCVSALYIVVLMVRERQRLEERAEEEEKQARIVRNCTSVMGQFSLFKRFRRRSTILLCVTVL